MARTRVPRASFGVTVLDDVDFAVLMDLGPDGWLAWTVFSVLVIQAKKVGNGGSFTEKFTVTAIMIQISSDSLKSGVETIVRVCDKNGTDPWLKINDTGQVEIRNFDQWQTSNSWGGSRKSQAGTKMTPSCSSPKNHLGAPLHSSDSDSDRGIPRVWNQAALRILKLYPPQSRGLPGAALDAICLALDKINDGDPQAAERMLSAKVKEFAKAVGSSKFTPSASKWFQGDGYDMEQSQWAQWNGRDGPETQNMSRVEAKPGKYDQIMKKAKSDINEYSSDDRKEN